MKKIVFFIIGCMLSGSLLAATLEVNLRNRPPDLSDAGEGSGPLKDIMELAAERAGHDIKWVKGPFKRALEDMKAGRVDFVPRTFFREDRLSFLHYLTPVGFQERDIVFFTKKGNEGKVNSYDDLKNVKVGVKRGTVFYPQFDKDTSLNKIEGTEDAGLAKMLIGDRFDVMISIDPAGVKQEFEKLGFSDYTYTNYKHTKRIGVYYASSKARYDNGKKAIYDAVDAEIKKMIESGEVDKIYAKHGAPTLVR